MESSLGKVRERGRVGEGGRVARGRWRGSGFGVGLSVSLGDVSFGLRCGFVFVVFRVFGFRFGDRVFFYDGRSLFI